MLEAKNHLSGLVKDALAGEDIVIASNGEPMVRLVPVARADVRLLLDTKVALWWLAPACGSPNHRLANLVPAKRPSSPDRN